MPTLKPNIADLEKLILDGFTSQLPDLKAQYVKARLDEDEFGDPVLEINVVLGNDNADPRELLSTHRKIRPILIEADMNAFPVFRFHSPDDAKELNIGF